MNKVSVATLFLWIAALVPTSYSTAAQADDDLNAAAEEILSEHFAQDGPGAAIAVLVDGDVVIETAIGLADIDREIAIDSNTVFDLASVSKQFTAAAILLLESDGEVDPQDPVSTYVEDYSVTSPRREVRVEDLLWHTSGLADYTADDWEGSDEEFAELTPESHLEWLNETTPRRAPGLRYVYNNSEYVLLALIVERVSGQSFAQFATDRLFKPAGMRATRITDRLGMRFPHQARGYRSDDDDSISISESPSAITGDGNVFSSLADMIAWMRALDGDDVLSAAQKHRAWTSGSLDSGEPIDDDGDGYGYGWVTDDEGRVSHSGSWMGTSTYLLRDDAEAVSVVVLSNDESADVASIAEALADLVE